ncbi:hypothetical protein DACRYDRAFT_99426 [Dacryopinax primogenitus]|uniref:Uncharacterized protein n=1 Tax=Dacryopinax primogenitus (strain DJM 731) TaxID=1858805 RepID=M5FY58_DACPD|nr:uncharacterized protein DACRYDRAFT_99426 [Dacryopinax primogenitus]EJU02996.1 hypothetical protein DACRYDRAFT_99426 [Dacryopinax primogenitus]
MSRTEPSSDSSAQGILFPRSHLRTSSYPSSNNGDGDQGTDGAEGAERTEDRLATLRPPALKAPISFRRLSTTSAGSGHRSAVSSVVSFEEVALQSPPLDPGSAGTSPSPRSALRPLSEQARSSSFSGFGPLSPALPRSPRKYGKSRRDSRQRGSMDEGYQRRALKRLKVVKELLDTERSYHFLIPLMESLETKRPLVTRDDLTAIFSNFVDIWNLHRALLLGLTEAVSPPPSQAVSPPLSSVMRAHLPYLSMYKLFVANFPSSMSTVSHLQSTSPPFRSWLAEREKDPRCRAMGLVAWLLTCVQRVPRYLLLLKDLVTYSDPHEEETEQLRRVFVMVSKTAETLDRALAEHSLTLSALALQRACINLPFPLISPGRKLIKRRPLLRESPKALEPRECLLFTDCILLFAPLSEEGWLSGSRPGLQRRRSKSGNDAQIRRSGEEEMRESERWRWVGKLEIKDVTVVGARCAGEGVRKFELLSPKESFAVYAASAAECQAWIDAIRETKSLYLSSIQTFSRPLDTLTSSTSTRHLRLSLQALPAEPERKKVEHFVPAVWVPDRKATACMRCGKPWTVLRRRHHCRLCGSVVCSRCSTKTFFIVHPGAPGPSENKPTRACNTCYENVFPLIAERSDECPDGLPHAALDHRLSTVTLSSTTSVLRSDGDYHGSDSASGFGHPGPELDNGLPELTPTLLELGVSPFAGALKRTEVQRLEVTARLSLVETGNGEAANRFHTIGGRAVKRLSVLLGKSDK